MVRAEVRARDGLGSSGWSKRMRKGTRDSRGYEGELRCEVMASSVAGGRESGPRAEWRAEIVAVGLVFVWAVTRERASLYDALGIC